VLDRWGAPKQWADGTLPVPGVYGVPEQWPHIRAAYEQAGFVHEGNTEIVYLAKVHDLLHPGNPPVHGVRLRRSVGVNGTRLSAAFGNEIAGYIEVDSLGDAGKLPRNVGMADIGNLHVAEEYRRRGFARWLVGQAGEWLRLAKVASVLAYAFPEEDGCTTLLEAMGFPELTRTERGWLRKPR
jgi:GNAT superfamily N-acetyltransferase